MTNKKYGKYIVIGIAIIASIIFGYFSDEDNTVNVINALTGDESLVGQEIVGLYNEPVEVIKVYYQDQLVGVISDMSVLETAKEWAYNAYYATNFPESEIRLNDDIYYYTEKTYYQYEDKDHEVAYYLFENDMFLVQAYMIEIGDTDVIYVKEQEDFEAALKEFALSFIDSDVYAKLEKNEEIETLTVYGTQDVNIYIEETITCTEVAVNAVDIMSSQEEILYYLCYGNDTELEYYTVEKYDTVAGVGSKNGLSAEQVVLINTSLSSVDQAIAEGMELNVTYFNSPITIVVEKERLTSEVIYQPSTLYVADSSLTAGEVVVTQEGSDGSQDCLYTEIYVNGVLTSYKLESTTVTKEAKQRIVSYGTGANYTYYGDYRLPTDNSSIICNYYCYAGHNGVDFIDRYDRWGYVHACADGTVISNGYNYLSGWSYEIDHGNGVVFRYSHFASQGWLSVGDTVTKGEVIANIGMTGYATTPHVHIAAYIDGVNVDACTVLPCEAAGY